jgi:hypothetical protein
MLAVLLQIADGMNCKIALVRPNDPVARDDAMLLRGPQGPGTVTITRRF